MSVLKYFKNIPRSASHRATGSKCNFFFFKFATKSLEKKKVGGSVAPQRATGACRPLGGRQAPPFFQGPILSYSSVYSSSSSARSRPLTPTARNLSFIKSREKSQELPLFHEHYGTHKHNKFTSIISIETNDK